MKKLYDNEITYEHNNCPLCGSDYDLDNIIETEYYQDYIIIRFKCRHCEAVIEEKYSLVDISAHKKNKDRVG